MKKNSLSILVLLLLLCLDGLSQPSRALPNIMSPEAANLGKYGSYNVNYHTGTPNISVPIHQVNVSGLQIPISISYDASGFIPNKNAGIVGLNWNLSAGGAITRTVNGVMDDKYDVNAENGSSANGTDKGYIYGQLHAGLQSYDPEFIRTNQYFSVVPIGPVVNGTRDEAPVTDLDYEYIPDIFSFNFLGHSGKFFMDNTGQVRVVSDKRYKVDLINLKPMYNFEYLISNLVNSANPVNSLNNTLVSQIKMTSDDGYQFFFGGAFKDLEISFSYDAKEYRHANGRTGVINAWYITKVITPENETILFKNKDYTDNDKKVIQRLFESNNGNWNTITAGFLELKYYRNHSITANEQINNSGPPISNTQSEVFKSLVKQVYLAEIETKTQKVKINYSEKDYTNRFYTQPITGNGGINVLLVNNNYYTSKVSDIQIWDNINGPVLPFEGDEVAPQFPTSKDIVFNYTYNSNRMFLTGLDINNVIKYSFQYSYPGVLPDPLTRGVDIWGFYNGKDGNTDLIGLPNLNYGTPGEYETDFTQSFANRLADPTYASYGMLNTIVYPTGGKTEFTFENHTYKKSLRRKVSGIEPVWITETTDKVAGGLRIKEIKNTPGTTSTFKYVRDYDQNVNNSSSGMLVNNGVNFMYFHKPLSGGSGYVHASVRDNNIEPATSYSESHIQYAQVVEINSDGYSKYTFSTHETNPDTYHQGNDSYKITAEFSASNFNGQLKRIYKYSSRAEERGKVLKTEIFNIANQLVKSVENTYNADPLRTNAKTYGIYCPYDFHSDYFRKWFGLQQSFAMYYYHDGITQTVEKTYSQSGGTPLVQTTTFKYRSNTDPTITEKSVTRSNGSVQTQKYKYVEDFASPGNVYQAMKDKFIVAELVEETTLIDNNIVRIDKHNYGAFAGTAGNIYRVESEKTINQKLQPGVEQNLLTVTGYTTNGSITEAYKNNDHYLAYIWDYKNSFPILQATNASSFGVAYTSFEADGNGGWSFFPAGVTNNALAPTGKKVYNLAAGSMDHSDISHAAHIVSYWSNGSSYTVNGTQSVKTGPTIRGWTYFEHTIANSSSATISGNGLIDEVRVYVKGAMVKTFTYEPLVGITTQSDENGRVTYYDYDAMGRLKHIRDGYRNIIKKLCYNFYNQVEECAANTSPVWMANGETRCKPCSINPAYFSNIQEHKEVDNNPLSATYGAVRWVEDGASPNCALADWQPTGNLRCEQFMIIGGGQVNSGHQEQEQKDMNPCSPTYNQLVWWDIGLNCTSCPTPANWQATGTVSCQTDANGNNTGYQLVQERDMSTCSPTYNTTRNTLVYNPTACPLPYVCDASNCSGNDKKCINNVCVTGTPVVVAKVWKKVLVDGLYQFRWVCTWKYCFPDGTTSIYSWETYSTTGCTVQMCGAPIE